MKISLVGSGNVTHVLARLIKNTPHTINQIICRRPAEVSQLALQLAIPSVKEFGQPIADSDLYIIAISDSALTDLHKSLQIRSGIIVHTAGAVSSDALAAYGPATGVLYPLQSLKKELEFIPEIPFLIYSQDTQTLEMLHSFALELSSTVQICTDEERKKYHLSAVMSSNFINHLLALSFDYCETEHIDPLLLQPLLMETVKRVKLMHPSLLQTGPAVRNDLITIDNHHIMLRDHPSLLRIYSVLSNNIIDYHKLRLADRSI